MLPPGVYYVMAMLRDRNGPAFARAERADTVPRYAGPALTKPIAVYTAEGRNTRAAIPKLVVNSARDAAVRSDSMRFYVRALRRERGGRGGWGGWGGWGAPIVARMWTTPITSCARLRPVDRQSRFVRRRRLSWCPRICRSARPSCRRCRSRGRYDPRALPGELLESVVINEL